MIKVLIPDLNLDITFTVTLKEISGFELEDVADANWGDIPCMIDMGTFVIFISIKL